MVKAFEKLNHKIFRTSQWALFVLLFSSLPVFSPSPIGIDVAMILQPAKAFSQTGSLQNIGISAAAQIFRDDYKINEQPYWYNYVFPVFIFAGAIKLFGVSDFTFYLTQSIFWLICFLLILKKLKSFLATTILFLAMIALDSIEGASFSAATQLPVLALFIGLWEDWRIEKTTFSIILIGILIGCGFHCRPEAIFILLFYLVEIILAWSKRLRAASALIFSFTLTFLAINQLRYILGGASSSDHTFYVFGTQVFHPYVSIEGYIDKIRPIQDIFYDPALIHNLTTKVIRGILRVFNLKSSLRSRPDFFVVIFCLLGACFYQPSRKRYLHLLGLLGFQILVNSLVLDVNRYYDYVFVLGLVQLSKDLLFWMRDFRLEKFPLYLNGLMLVLISLICFRTIRAHYSHYDYYKTYEIPHRNTMKKVVQSLNGTDLIITNTWWELLWYGEGNYAGGMPLTVEGMQRLISKFPNTVVVFFDKVPWVTETPLKALTKFKEEQITDGIRIFRPQADNRHLSGL